MVASVMELLQDFRSPYHNPHHESWALVQSPDNPFFRLNEVLCHKTTAEHRGAVLVSLAQLCCSSGKLATGLRTPLAN